MASLGISFHLLKKKKSVLHKPFRIVPKSLYKHITLIPKLEKEKIIRKSKYSKIYGKINNKDNYL